MEFLRIYEQLQDHHHITLKLKSKILERHPGFESVVVHEFIKIRLKIHVKYLNQCVTDETRRRRKSIHFLQSYKPSPQI